MTVKTGSIEKSDANCESSEQFVNKSIEVSLSGSKSVARLTCKLN